MSRRTIETIRYPLRVRRLGVRRVGRFGPHCARVLLGGDDLADLRSDSPIDHIKVALPDAATGELRLPRVVDDRPVLDGPRPVSRDYTIWRFDAAARELELFVLDHGRGPISRGLAGAQPGDAVGTMGPRGSELVPDGYADYLLIGDRTAIPAIWRWIEWLPDGATARVMVAAAGEEDVLELPARDGVEVRWLTEADGGVDADQLPAVVEALDVRSPDTWAWAAGETLAMREVRRLLREKPALSAETVDVHGYWRRERSDWDHHAPLDAD